MTHSYPRVLSGNWYPVISSCASPLSSCCMESSPFFYSALFCTACNLCLFFLTALENIIFHPQAFTPLSVLLTTLLWCASRTRKGLWLCLWMMQLGTNLLYSTCKIMSPKYFFFFLIRALLHCVDSIWSQQLHSSDWVLELQLFSYHLFRQPTCEQGSAGSRNIINHLTNNYDLCHCINRFKCKAVITVYSQ